MESISFRTTSSRARVAHKECESLTGSPEWGTTGIVMKDSTCES
jgi:hypothetical protein